MIEFSVTKDVLLKRTPKEGNYEKYEKKDQFSRLISYKKKKSNEDWSNEEKSKLCIFYLWSIVVTVVSV